MIRPRLAVDARFAAGPLSGFGRFTWNLLEGLATIGPPEPVLVLHRPGQATPAGLGDATGLIWKPIDRSPYSPLSQRAVARMLADDGVTVMVSPDVFAPFCRAPKQAITLHDIIPLRCPHLLNRSAKGRFSFAWRQWLRLQVGAADGVLTVSDHARSDIASVFKGSEEKLRTVYNAVRVDASTLERDGALSDGAVHLLYVGRTAAYKNITGCIDTVAVLRRQGLDAKLTIVGEPDPRYPEAQQLVDRLGLGEAIVFTGHIDEPRLQALYRSASVFLFLSYYEGFGLPPLEAMAHGVPVVSSDRSAMPEVLGDAALLVNPDDISAAATAVRRIIEAPDLAATLRERGLARAKTFTVDRQAAMFWNAVSPLLDPDG